MALPIVCAGLVRDRSCHGKIALDACILNSWRGCSLGNVCLAEDNCGEIQTDNRRIRFAVVSIA